MICPYCERPTRVLESRQAEAGAAVRRRRECSGCERRFTTFEVRRPDPLWVRKRDGERQAFDRAKLSGGLERAAHKRPVAPGAIERVVTTIENEVEAAGGEVEAERIGDICLRELERLDRIAYLQFAAVYKGFSDPGEMAAELRRMDASAERNLGESGGAVPSGARRTVDGPSETQEI